MKLEEKMKKILAIIALLIVSSIVIAQTTDSKLNKTDDFEKLAFDVQFNKKSYLPIEPMFVKFRVSNLTSEIIRAEPPQFLLHSFVKVVKPTGKIVKLGNLSLTSGGGVNLPGGMNCLRPQQSYEEVGVPAFDPNVFADVGNYQIQFYLNGVESNVIELEILYPIGINKSAFEFLNVHGKDIWFGKILQEKEGDQLLKTFVEQYSTSDYGDYAIASLGKYYLFFEKDLDKARAELEKIKANENPMIANEAKKLIADIEREKANSKKMQIENP